MTEEEEIKESIKKKKEKDFKTLISSVEKVIVIAAHTLADPDVWHISIRGKKEIKTMEIRTSKLDSPTAFRQQYIQHRFSSAVYVPPKVPQSLHPNLTTSTVFHKM